MQFGLTETQETLKKSAREFLNAECPIALVRTLTETAFDITLWSKIAEQGWTGLLIPEEYGGHGIGMVEMAVVLEEMGRALVPGPFLSTTLLAGTVLERGGTAEQKRKYLPAIARGEVKATVAYGKFTPHAGIADLILCAAPLDGEFAIYIAREPRVTFVPSLDLTRPLYEVLPDARNVAESDVIVRGSKARELLDSALDIGAAGLTAEMTGGMQRLLDMTVAYAKTRKQFGCPIGQFQAVQHMCADMFLMTESARSAALHACYAVNERPGEAAEAVSIAKSYASDAYREVGNRAIQIHGGMGFLWENDCHLYYRRAKASELAFGDASHHRERLAKIMLERKRTTAAVSQ